MKLDLSRQLYISKTAPFSHERNTLFVMGKMAEENGEIATAIIQPYRCKETVFGECADYINCIVDLLRLTVKHQNYGNLTDEEIDKFVQEELQYQLDMKSVKWAQKVNANMNNYKE
ncbi:hypothetical protein HPMBJEAJ_00333 [Aeromonas phage avDM6]|nr:hypothetical protein HPMBJEAJ_00333 [Aeromonas phage avDM6]